MSSQALDWFANLETLNYIDRILKPKDGLSIGMKHQRLPVKLYSLTSLPLKFPGNSVSLMAFIV